MILLRNVRVSSRYRTKLDVLGVASNNRGFTLQARNQSTKILRRRSLVAAAPLGRTLRKSQESAYANVAMCTETPPPFVVAFYDPKIRAEDGEGRTLNDILRFSDDQLEYYHDYIQYLFPLPEPSPINPYAPTITKEVRTAFLSREDLRKELRRSFLRLLAFYGFSTNTERSIVPGETFERDSRLSWCKRMDHNHLRITRIIRSLRVLGLEADAKAFYRALLENDQAGRVGRRTLMFWQRAAERDLRLAPQQDDDAEGVEWLLEEHTDANADAEKESKEEPKEGQK